MAYFGALRQCRAVVGIQTKKKEEILFGIKQTLTPKSCKLRKIPWKRTKEERTFGKT